MRPRFLMTFAFFLALVVSVRATPYIDSIDLYGTKIVNGTTMNIWIECDGTGEEYNLTGRDIGWYEDIDGKAVKVKSLYEFANFSIKSGELKKVTVTAVINGQGKISLCDHDRALFPAPPFHLDGVYDSPGGHIIEFWETNFYYNKMNVNRVTYIRDNKSFRIITGSECTMEGTITPDTDRDSYITNIIAKGKCYPLSDYIL